jgi:hypothetical protein
MTKTRARWLAEGRCYQCGKMKAPGTTAVRCEWCRPKAAAQYKKWRAKQPKPPKKVRERMEDYRWQRWLANPPEFRHGCWE